MLKTTLKTRLIVLMIAASIFLASAFTIIQLRNQLKRSSEFNVYRANLGTFVTRDKLNTLFSDFVSEPPLELILPRIEEIFSFEIDSGMIDGAALLDKKGTILASKGKTQTDQAYDRRLLRALYKNKDKAKISIPTIDKKLRIINQLIAPDNAFGYIVQLSFSLGNIQQALKDVYVPVMFTIIIVIFGNIILATLLSKIMISPIMILHQAAKDIAGGNLEHKIIINTNDELEDLAQSFNYMTVELKRMKEKAENANPLTKLPGNIVIREQVDKRIRDKSKFALIYADLDNFKAFNDKYGIHAGDDAIMMTANILAEGIKRFGSDKDFVGHEGGDDFLLLTSPEKAGYIADYIIKEFDTSVTNLYQKEDLARGYIEAKSRDGDRMAKFPVMTISLAGVSNVKKEIVSYSQLSNIAAEIKKVVKGMQGSHSKFVMDRREQDLGIEGRGQKTA